MRPPLVTRKLAPLATSMALPPPTATSRSAAWRRATAAAASTCRAVGFSSTPSKTATSSPASPSACTARCGWPASSSPGSVTSRARRPPSSRASSPSRAIAPASKITRPSGTKSNGGGSAAARPRGLLSVGVGRWDIAMRLLGGLGRVTGSDADRLLVELERPGPEQEVHDAPLVRLQPVQLDRGDRADVQPVDVDRVHQVALELLVGGDRRADQRRADPGQHLVLRALDDRDE